MQLLVDAGSDTPLHLALNYNLRGDIPPYPNTAKRSESDKRSVEILLSRGARLSDIESLSREMVRWASSGLWYSDLILTDEDDGLRSSFYPSESVEEVEEVKVREDV